MKVRKHPHKTRRTKPRRTEGEARARERRGAARRDRNAARRREHLFGRDGCTPSSDVSPALGSS